MTSDSGLPLNPDFRDMLACLLAHGVDFMVVGGFAVAAHGFVRATKDLDLLVRPEPDNAARLVTALQAFGAPLMGAAAADFCGPGTVFQIGVPPRRIDILTSITGVSYATAAARVCAVTLGGLAVPVIGKDALIENKRATGRAEDLKDVHKLTRRQEP